MGEVEAWAKITSGLASGAASPRHPGREAAPTGGATGGGDAAAWPIPDLSVLEPARDAPPALPVREVFGVALGHWIETAAEGKGAPVDYVAGALIPIAGSLIGNARWAQPYGDWKEPPVFWTMLVGPPSSRKSPGLDAVRAPLQAVADRIASGVEIDHKAWRERKELADLRLDAWKEQVKRDVKKGLPPPERPPEADPGEEPLIPRLEVNDTTVEGLTKILDRQLRGTLVIRDELAGWLGGMNRYNTGNGDRPFWIEAYGGRRHNVDRAGKDRAVIKYLSVSLVGTIQPDPLASLLLRPDDDGMVARFWPFWPLLAPAKRPVERVDMASVERAFARLFSLDMVADELGKPTPMLVPFSLEAQSLLDAFLRTQQEWESECEGEGLLVSFVGKTPGMTVRFALLLCMLDWAFGHDLRPPSEISADYYNRAVRFVSE